MNKKLIKTIASITCGLGIALTIPSFVSSCGCSSTPLDKKSPLPNEVYNITNGTILHGFTTEFLDNQDDYKNNYDTMLIPIDVNSIVLDAFDSKIPSFITSIIFQTKEGERISTDYGAFSSNHSITSVVLPGNLKHTNQGIFMDCSNLSSITWDAWDCATFATNGFAGVAPKGTVKVTNPIDDAHNSAALLDTLKQKAGLPEGWTVAK